MSAEQRVLDKLRSKRKGVTICDFGKGFRLAARVHDLRKAGYGIETIKDDVPGGYIARYVMTSEA